MFDAIAKQGRCSRSMKNLGCILKTRGKAVEEGKNINMSTAEVLAFGLLLAFWTPLLWHFSTLISMSYAQVPTTEADDRDYKQQQQQHHHHHHHHHQESLQQQQRSLPAHQHYKVHSISCASLNLSCSEAGSFLGQSNLNLDNVSYPLPHCSATASGSSKLTMLLSTKWLVFFLLTDACLIWLLSPAQRRQDVTSYINDKAGQVLDKMPCKLLLHHPKAWSKIEDFQSGTSFQCFIAKPHAKEGKDALVVLEQIKCHILKMGQTYCAGAGQVPQC
ncbi:hypothetical protein ACQY0O_002203 [Thecaphora frezii]